ncbi:MAG: hypothetical protein PHP51_02820 [Desulfotomaculaceae bacterium]|nr:hypothetical protein [Desulfotomaculaceae bacterium]
MRQSMRNEEAFYCHQEQTEPPKRTRPRKSFNITRSTLPAVVLSLLLVYLVISFCTQFCKLSSMQRDVQNIQLQVQEMQQRNTTLRE